jgi:hypothetical protein
MDAAIISALSGLAGAAIGGATSAFSSVLSEVTKNRRKTAEDLFNRRVKVYDDFIKEAAEHYVDALTRESDDPKALVSLYALVAIMRLGSPREVVMAAEAVMVDLRKVYEAPNRTLSQISMYSEGGDADPLLGFSGAARKDLESSKASLLR